jgi:hypothetical protein
MRLWSYTLLALHLLVVVGLWTAGLGVDHPHAAGAFEATVFPGQETTPTQPAGVLTSATLDMDGTEPSIEPDALHDQTPDLAQAPGPQPPSHPQALKHTPPALDGLHRPPRTLV